MAAKRQIYWLLFLLNTHLVLSTSSKEDLDGAEANGKLEIVKQIKKVNDDGSYTIGYEADDGSFKIESRDILGNVKGTYGYIDENGQIKRVSYSTNNSSEVIAKPEAASVVQRIPKINRTSSTTRRPNVIYHAVTTQATPSISTTKRRTTTSLPPTTTDSKYSDFIKAAVEASKSTLNKQGVYEQNQPRILLQQRSTIRSDDILKSEGQLVRPDVAGRPTEVPIYRRKDATLLENDQRLGSEGNDGKGNLLRRQLLPEKVGFDAKQHALNLQQSHGDDVVDVYSSSLTTGTARPLFTTSRPQYLSSTISPTIQRPTIKYAQYQKPNDQEYHQEASTENIQSTTPTPVPIVQIPANRDMPNTLVAIHHPVHGRTILVPLSQLQNQNLENVQYNEQYLRETTTAEQPISLPIYVRQQSQKFRAIPVRVDENGYIREMPQYQSVTTPYPLPIRTPPLPVGDYINREEEINLIKPPVSTRDFQRLLEQLILRQSRLEQISYLSRRYDQMFGHRQRPIYRPGLMYQRKGDEENGMHYVDEQNLNLEQQNFYNYFPPGTSESYTPTRRVARLLSARHLKDDDDDEDYLPADVREMLLLKMLQLAINPALPLSIPDNFDQGISLPVRHRKMGARNVEILGEEDDDKPSRSKR